ncbi:MAG: hypothetical protein ACXACR_08275 [Candidatus Hodarchaeales archaeon]|jgi:KaiC/GvpD/RAD55 family RecA-like ATPase
MTKNRGFLPHEFPELNKMDIGYSILIKGLPGTGKSILALELVTKFPNSFFITTRIKPDAIMHDFPWVMNELHLNRSQPFFVDATRSDTKSENSFTLFKIYILWGKIFPIKS